MNPLYARGVTKRTYIVLINTYSTFLNTIDDHINLNTQNTLSSP